MERRALLVGKIQSLQARLHELRCARASKGGRGAESSCPSAVESSLSTMLVGLQQELSTMSTELRLEDRY